jgi:hypothetical protein
MNMDYWVSRLFYDLHNNSQLADQYRADRQSVLSAYPLSPKAKTALLRDDVSFLAARTNAFLLRYYFSAAGMAEKTFLERISCVDVDRKGE